MIDPIDPRQLRHAILAGARRRGWFGVPDGATLFLDGCLLWAFVAFVALAIVLGAIHG